MKNLFKKSSSGFTLIELLVVIAIIAILSTIVLASLSQARARALVAKINSQLNQVPAAVELAANSSAYPVTTACNVAPWTDVPSGLSKLVTAANYPGGTAVACASNGTSYTVVLSSTVPSATTYCVDASATVKAGSTSTTVAGNLQCS